MKSSYLLVILAISSASLLSGIGLTTVFMPLSSSYYTSSNEEPTHVAVAANQFNSNKIISQQDNGSSYAAVNPVTNRIYVSNEFSKTVSVIDGSNNTEIASIPVDGVPLKLDVNPTTNRIYVIEGHDDTNNIDQNDTVTVIDGSNNAEIANIEVGVGPSGIAVNPTTNKIYVTQSYSTPINGRWQNGTVSVIDGNDNTKIASIQVNGAALGIAINPTTNRIYIAGHPYFTSIEPNGTVTVIDGSNNTEIASIAVGRDPLRLDINPVTNRIYVANYRSGTVSVIDGNNNTVIGNKQIQVDFGAEGIAINPLTNKIYVANGITETVYVIDGNDTGRRSKVDEIGKLFAYDVAVNPNTNRIYVPSYALNNLSVIDGKHDNVMAVIQLGTYPD